MRSFAKIEFFTTKVFMAWKAQQYSFYILKVSKLNFHDFRMAKIDSSNSESHEKYFSLCD